MNKKNKKTFIVIAVIVAILTILYFVIGNAFYQLALNPNTDKSRVFENEETQNENKYVIEDTFFKDHTYKDLYTRNENLNLHAYNFDQKSDTTVILIHGYLANGSTVGIPATYFYEQGFDIVAPDLRGHGESDGDYIGMGWDDRNDIIAWINLILEDSPNEKIILYGVSMGATTVMNTIGEKLPQNVKLAIEDCGFTSPWDIFDYQMKSLFSLPTHPFMDSANTVTKIRAGYNLKNSALDQLPKSIIPTLFIHGDQDTFVPFFMFDDIYEAANNPKEKLIIEGAGHGQSYLKEPELYWSTVSSFIEKYLK
ncbi:MAG: alpha/beta hydrolase [Anaerorhabdus sp.]